MIISGDTFSQILSADFLRNTALKRCRHSWQSYLSSAPTSDWHYCNSSCWARGRRYSVMTASLSKDINQMFYLDSLSPFGFLLDDFVFDSIASFETSAWSLPLSNSINDHTPVPLNLSEPPKAYFPRSNALLMDQ